MNLRQSYLLLRLCLAATVALMATSAPAASNQQVTLYITDFGIAQWNERLRLGDGFGETDNEVFGDLKEEAQILVPMPSDQDWNPRTQHELPHDIREAITQKVRAGLAHGITTFEIQLVQNINRPGYADPFRQARVNQFGAAAYRAIGEGIKEFRADGIEVSSYAITGSNGTKVLTENVDSLRLDGDIYLNGVDLVDGRAFLVPTSDLIEAIGADSVRIFNTFGDLPAPYTPIGFRSIGNFETAIALKDRFPELRSYLLTYETNDRGIGYSHISGMRDLEAMFTVREYVGDRRLRQLGNGRFSGRQLRAFRSDGTWRSALDQAPAGTAVPHRPISGPVLEFIGVHRGKVEQLATGIFAYADVLKEAHEQTLRQLPFMRDTRLSPRELSLLRSGRILNSVSALSEAIHQDLRNHSQGRFVFLRSHTLEAMGRFGLDVISFLDLENKLELGAFTEGALARIGGFAELLEGLAEHAGQGRVDVDIITHYINGTKALAGAELAARNRLTSRFALLDGFQELATAGYLHLRQGHLDVDLVTRYLDAVNNLAWTGLGISVCGGTYACTAAIQGFGTALAPVLRDSTRDSFHQALVTWRGDGQRVIEQWLSTQQRNVIMRQPIQTISEIYTVEGLRRLGLSDEQIDELDQAALSFNAALPPGPPPPPPPPPPGPSAGPSPPPAPLPVTSPSTAANPRGGIDLGVGPPTVVETDLSDTTRAVLGGRDDPDKLSEDFD